MSSHLQQSPEWRGGVMVTSSQALARSIKMTKAFCSVAKTFDLSLIDLARVCHHLVLMY